MLSSGMSLPRVLLAASASVLLFGSFAPEASATTALALDLRELVQRADHVLVATALSQRARHDALGRIVTDTTLRVQERVYGPPSAGEDRDVVVRTLGGIAAGVGLLVEGEARFTMGERYLIFARGRAPEAWLHPIEMAQGVMPIHRIAGADMVMPGSAGMALRQRGSDGQLRSAPPALMQPMPFDELLAQVRELVFEVHGAN